MTQNNTELNEISNQPESLFENILEYFDDYIKSFYAYKDEPTYRAIISFFIKYYIDIIYNIQPDKFKQLFENQTIGIDLIDLLLVNIGLPESVIRSITTTSKFVIMKSFSDFERYKGTIKFFRSIGGAFSDVMSYYELYIDYDEKYVNPVGRYLLTIERDKISNGSYFLISSVDKEFYVWFNLDETGIDPELPDKIGVEINYTDLSSSSSIANDIIEQLNLTQEFYLNVNSFDILEIQVAKHGEVKSPPSGGTTELVFKTLVTGKDDGAWVLRPRPVYIHPKMKQVTEVFTYQTAYNKIPTLLVPEEQLSELKSRNELVLPTKSNIILLDYTSTIDSSPLNTLIFTILMENIGDDLFSVFLTGSSGTTTISYNTAFFLWYYLLARYYNVTLEGVDLMWHITMGTHKVTEYVLEDIPRLEEEYKNIKTSTDIYNFYLKYIEEPFGRPYENDKPTVPIMGETLRKIDTEMWEYVENRIATAENPEQDIRFLLDELYASITLSFDRYKDRPIIYKYIPLLLQFVTQITTNIKNTDSYKIVYNLKPFHTEILDLTRNKIVIDDKFNSVLFDDSYDVLYKLIVADILHMSDQFLINFSPKSDGSSLPLISITDIKMMLEFKDSILNNEYYNFLFKMIRTSAAIVSDKSIYNFNLFLDRDDDALKLDLSKIINFNFINRDSILDNEYFDFLFKMIRKDTSIITDEIKHKIIPKDIESLGLISAPSINIKNKSFQDRATPRDSFTVKLSSE